MTTLTLRAVKGSALTQNELDDNFTSINTSKLEASSNLSDLTNAATARTNLGVAIGVNVQAYSAELAAVAALSTGIAVRTGAGAWAARTIAVAAAGLAITFADGVSGNPTIALANDLSALEALASTGIAVRTTTDTWAQRSVAGTSNRITVTNGDGVSGNPTVDISASYVGQATITTVGTIATGTWTSTITTADSVFTLTNGTKNAKFSAASISGGTTRTYTLPDVTDTLVTLGATQTLTAKTLTSPTINTPVVSGGTIDNTVIGGTTKAAGGFTTVTLTGVLALPTTTSASAGVITSNGSRFIHAYGANNLFLGAGSGNFTTTGTVNTGIGASTLSALTSGSYNSAVGYGTLVNATSGSYNTGVGAQSLAVLTTGSNNVAIGALCLSALTSGTDMIAIGFLAMPYATTAASCVAIGTGALNAITTGGGNVAVGVSSMTNTVGGIDNAAVGNRSLLANTSGERNAALGTQALQSLTTGFNNVGIGYSAGEGTTTGSGNICVGSFSGATTVSANANISGSYNTWVGYGSGPSTTTQLTNATAIGNGATSSTSNEVTLGNASVTVIRSMAVNLCDLGTSATPMKTVYAGTSVVVGLTTNNGVTISAVASASTPTIAATGTDTNMALSIFSKGTGNLNMIAASTGSVRAFTNTSLVQLEIYHTASADRYVRITGANASNPSITTSAGSLILTGASAQVAFGSAALATNATTGFVCIPSCAGAPSGVPASIPTGQIPMVYDSTNNFLYVYSGGWKKSTVYA